MWFQKTSDSPARLDDIKLQVAGDYTRFNEARTLALRLSPNKRENDDGRIFYGAEDEHYMRRTMSTTRITRQKTPGGMVSRKKKKANGFMRSMPRLWHTMMKLQHGSKKKKKKLMKDLLIRQKVLKQMKLMKLTTRAMAKEKANMMVAPIVAASGILLEDCPLGKGGKASPSTRRVEELGDGDLAIKEAKERTDVEKERAKANVIGMLSRQPQR